MDLLCTESIVTHSERSLHRFKKKTPTEQQITNDFNINCNCITCSSICFSTIAKCNTETDATTDSIPAVSVRVPSACNMGKLVYVISSVATPTTPTLSTKELKQTQLNNDQLLYQLPTHHQCNNSKLTAITNETEAVGDKRFVYENAHVIVTDPIFKSDRCLENAIKSEVKAQILGTYLKTVQKDITPPMRKIVAEWMMEVCAEEKCQDEVVLLAINYMDRFLSTKSVRKTHLQILAAACLLVASKIREPTCRALSAELLVFYTDNSVYKDDLIKWELYVLSRLGWDISSVTPLDFLELWIIRLPMKCKDLSDLNTEKVRHLAQAFICLAAKEYTIVQLDLLLIISSRSVKKQKLLKKWSSAGHEFEAASECNIRFLYICCTN
ncbi:G1/S-specific cyclin-D3 isoform X3 [Drosophila virilis]|uniref:G1/S-specific cyclin-D3 isoform X3 n=1 Tax=Drosophila virilis TaxID=7244 RepID=UPI001395CC30|nr:G1/S-specific cyclin-D3 isoform X3 [Drosophila virilis]